MFAQIQYSVILEEMEVEQDGQGKPQGTPILHSQWIPLDLERWQQVTIFTNGIQCIDKFIPFRFDLKFQISEGVLTLSEYESSWQWRLKKEDCQLWQGHLKRSLCQKGFHEQFKPMKKIGRGNFASVYLVERLCDGQKMAVKAFSKQSAFSEQNGKECLVKEIQIMRCLSCSHNLALRQVFQSQNSLYIVFQLITGGQLYERIKSKEKFKPKQVQTIMRCLLNGLLEMHKKGIMHRDLKPENILLRNQKSCECVIADFGLAEFSQAEEYLFVRCGTPGYVAPEVINIKDMKTKYSPICDMFSLGLIFHLLIFGKSIFKGKTYNQVLNQNRSCSFQFTSQEYQKIDPVTMDLLEQLLSVDPITRISAEDALKHEYITQEMMDEEQSEEMMEEERDKVEIGESPILTTANEQRKQDKDLKRDSCLSFKMGKDNLLTGKTDTAGTMESGKLSGFGSNLLKNFKPSKFVKPSLKENASSTQ